MNNFAVDLIRYSGELSIRAFHFLDPEGIDLYRSTQVYAIAGDVIECSVMLGRSTKDSSCYLPHYFWRMVLLAAYCILRICKSPLKAKLDMKEAETTFFNAVDILKKHSAQNNDLEAISGVMLTQLWSSQRAFVRNGGEQNGLHLDIKSRLVGLCRQLKFAILTDY